MISNVCRAVMSLLVYLACQQPRRGPKIFNDQGSYDAAYGGSPSSMY